MNSPPHTRKRRHPRVAWTPADFNEFLFILLRGLPAVIKSLAMLAGVILCIVLRTHCTCLQAASPANAFEVDRLSAEQLLNQVSPAMPHPDLRRKCEAEIRTAEGFVELGEPEAAQHILDNLPTEFHPVKEVLYLLVRILMDLKE